MLYCQQYSKNSKRYSTASTSAAVWQSVQDQYKWCSASATRSHRPACCSASSQPCRSAASLAQNMCSTLSPSTSVNSVACVCAGAGGKLSQRSVSGRTIASKQKFTGLAPKRTRRQLEHTQHARAFALAVVEHNACFPAETVTWGAGLSDRISGTLYRSEHHRQAGWQLSECVLCACVLHARL